MGESKPQRWQRCVACGRIIRFPWNDTPVHSKECARLLLLRIVESVPGVIELLPLQWRSDLPVATEAARKARSGV